MSRATDVEACAATWLVRREEEHWTARDEAELQLWLQESAAHRAAFWRLEYGWRRADRLAALTSDARKGVDAGIGTRRVRAALLAACLVLATALGFWAIREPGSAPAMFTTDVGGHRLAVMSDGSRVELNTASHLRAEIGRRSRQVWLDQGEAYFEVAHDRDRPFVVHAGDTRVTVLGTKFVVRRDEDKVTVSVVQGRVKVEEAGGHAIDRASVITSGDIALSQGDSMLLAPRSEQRVEAQLAWRQGRIDFDNTTLGQAALEFNRYNRRQLIVSEDLSDLRIGGSFAAQNLDGFVRMLRDAYDLSVTQTGDRFTISS